MRASEAALLVMLALGASQQALAASQAGMRQAGVAARLDPTEQLLFDAINDERRRRGLAPLTLDPRLVELAREHALEMRARGFVGHVSPTRGDLETRLRAAGYTTRLQAENVASASSAAEVHRGLMESAGHRASILAPEVTHVGLGAVPATNQGGVIAAQIFATPVSPQAPERLEQALLSRVDAARAAAGLQAADRPALLRRIAREVAATLAGEALSEESMARRGAALVEQALDAAGVGYLRKVVLTGTAFTAADVEIPDAAADAGPLSVGAGAAEPDAAGRLTFVLVMLD